MKVLDFEMYFDGGTIGVFTDEGNFYFDGRISSTTENCIYNEYPLDDNTNLIENSEELKIKIIESLRLYKDKFYQDQVDNFIKTNEILKK